jgi:hypothetical protein
MSGTNPTRVPTLTPYGFGKKRPRMKATADVGRTMSVTTAPKKIVPGIDVHRLM